MTWTCGERRLVAVAGVGQAARAVWCVSFVGAAVVQRVPGRTCCAAAVVSRGHSAHTVRTSHNPLLAT